MTASDRLSYTELTSDSDKILYAQIGGIETIFFVPVYYTTQQHGT